ncbi:BET1 homolog [Strongylocentrotus purpuratus]|uniref:BET1 homolog n=1 Tax=Strongylocentrotus purpuratus TaxID=7668 RepID=A0A7M7PAA8_STRPU|nr:BET1 homolog [Strongylocentrotus purpuratus]
MRRAAGGGGGTNPTTSQGYGDYNAVEEENQHLTENLRSKVSVLKTLSIDMGHEVNEQNKLLSDMDQEFDASGGFLGATMGRLSRLSKGGLHCHYLYLFLFAAFVFFIIYVILKSR